MQMGPKEIAVEYRTAVNKQKQIKVLAELNQCAEHKIAEILAEEGEELPAKWVDQLKRTPKKRGPRPRQLPEAETAETTADAPPGPEAEPEEILTVNADPDAWILMRESDLEPVGDPSTPLRCAQDDRPDGISAEQLLREACRLMAGALDLEPPAFHRYSAGVLDLVNALTGEV